MVQTFIEWGLKGVGVGWEKDRIEQWAGELSVVLLCWVLKMLGEDPLYLTLSHIARKHFSSFKNVCRIPILQILRVQLDYYINIIVWNRINTKFLSPLSILANWICLLKLPYNGNALLIILALIVFQVYGLLSETFGPDVSRINTFFGF